MNTLGIKKFVHYRDFKPVELGSELVHNKRMFILRRNIKSGVSNSNRIVA